MTARLFTILLGLTLLTFTAHPNGVFADGPGPDADRPEPQEEAEGDPLIKEILLYLPNRIFDLCDIFRLRARVGPGFAFGVRATELVNGFAGSYTSVYAGLPGPRGETAIPLPVGLESHNGATVSVVDATVDGGLGPDYSSSEFGFGFQLGIIGADVGIDPVEILDFATGIFLIDLQGDDY